MAMDPLQEFYALPDHDGRLTPFLLYRLITCTHNYRSRGPLKNGCRKYLVKRIYANGAAMVLFVAGCYSSLTHLDFDYSYYLGEGYREKGKADDERKIKHLSTYVSNHTSWMDMLVLFKHVQPAYTPSMEFKNAPIVSGLADNLDSIYVARGGSEEKRAQALAAIK